MIETNTPIDSSVVRRKIEGLGLKDIGKASIRELVKLVNNIEAETGQKYIRMEMGVPGFDPPEYGTIGEISALNKGLASKYPMIEGVSELKKEISRFIKLFLDIEIDEAGCLPTVGSTMGSFACFLMANRTDKNKEGTLFIDPGFPVHKQQCKFLGQNFYSFDVYNFRGDKLKDKLESYLKSGNVSSILYSNPNNPSWICFTEKELKIIGNLANKYDAIIIEDLAYFGMDFRQDYSVPGKPPYQPTVARYTSNYILLISSSKAFSYAGQRVGMMAVSNALFNQKFPDLKRYYSRDEFGYSMIYGALYALSAGVSHSGQYGLAAMLKATNDGEYNFLEKVSAYGERAKLMKKLFIENGFKIVYDMDEDKPIADGFYFTFSYPGMNGSELLEYLLYYGISAITLEITGSERNEGLRACVSQIHDNQINDLALRLKKFNEYYKKH
jgi:aspartate/methionine/tyrosine aminotransferase